MKLIYQTTFGELNGNCFAACIASLLELPIESVPNFCSLGVDWLMATNKWLKSFDLWFLDTRLPKPIDLSFFYGYYIVSGKSPRHIDHSVIYKDSEMIHDPHPEGGGVVPEFAGFLISLQDTAQEGEKEEEKDE